MPITVHTRLNGSHIFTKGASWHTDDEGRLHVRDAANKHIAVFNRVSWDAAHEGVPKSPEAEGE